MSQAILNIGLLPLEIDEDSIPTSTFELTEEEQKENPLEVFELLERRGKGTYGIVFKARHKRTDHIVAIKQVPLKDDIQVVMKEIEYMKNCKSEYIVQFYGYYIHDGKLWIVMEYCGAGSISDIITICKSVLLESQIKRICRDALMGLQYLHSKHQIHRDVKAGNIVLAISGRAKLVDFGVSAQLTETTLKRNTLTGTPYWIAPEVVMEDGYDEKADIWSLGITCIEMAEGKPPYYGMKPMLAMFKIPAKPPPRLANESNFSSEFVDFLSRCLTKKAADRPNATELLKHPFLSKIQSVRILSSIIEEAVNKIAKGALDSSETHKESTLKKLKKQKRKKKITDANEALDDDIEVVISENIKSLKRYEGKGSDPFYPKKGIKGSHKKAPSSEQAKTPEEVDTGTIKAGAYDNDTVKITRDLAEEQEPKRSEANYGDSDTVKITRDDADPPQETGDQEKQEKNHHLQEQQSDEEYYDDDDDDYDDDDYEEEDEEVLNGTIRNPSDTDTVKLTKKEKKRLISKGSVMRDDEDEDYTTTILAKPLNRRTESEQAEAEAIEEFHDLINGKGWERRQSAITTPFPFLRDGTLIGIPPPSPSPAASPRPPTSSQPEAKSQEEGKKENLEETQKEVEEEIQKEVEEEIQKEVEEEIQKEVQEEIQKEIREEIQKENQEENQEEKKEEIQEEIQEENRSLDGAGNQEMA